MYSKLENIRKHYQDIQDKLSDPSICKNQDLYRSLMKEYTELEPIVGCYRQFIDAKETIEELGRLSNGSLDKEFREMVEEELALGRKTFADIETQLKILLLPKDPHDDKSVIIEIRAGAGGDEAALFVSDLFRMYSMYAESKGWKSEVLNANPIGIGGLKEIIFSVETRGAYSRLKYECGVHRVQRIPKTESSGRIHTSTVTVAVLPEADEVDVEVNPADVEIDTYRASGAGGQHVNTTDSAIRLTHKPTGIVVTCQDERSQHKNRDKAFKILRAKLYEIALEKQGREISQARKSQVGTGDRSERIRTYNFPQGRVTDHRIGLTLYKLDSMMNGDLDYLLDALITEDQSKRLSKES